MHRPGMTLPVPSLNGNGPRPGCLEESNGCPVACSVPCYIHIHVKKIVNGSVTVLTYYVSILLAPLHRV